MLAEGLAGSEARFAQYMTWKARQLGMTRTIFRNANGLPDPGQHTTARDMARLALALYRDFPRQYAYFATRHFDFRGKMIVGHNHLLDFYDGADGLKKFAANPARVVVTDIVMPGLDGIVADGTSLRARADLGGGAVPALLSALGEVGAAVRRAAGRRAPRTGPGRRGRKPAASPGSPKTRESIRGRARNLERRDQRA